MTPATIFISYAHADHATTVALERGLRRIARPLVGRAPLKIVRDLAAAAKKPTKTAAATKRRTA